MAKKIVDEDMVLNIIINGDKGRCDQQGCLKR